MSGPRSWTGRSGRRYSEVKQVGAGGQGVVYEVRDDAGKTWALKAAEHGADLADEVDFDRRRRESDGSIDQFVVAIEDIGPDFYVMPLFEGNLGAYFGAKPGLRRVIEACWKAAECVQAFHQRGWVHRDLKPHNFLYRMDDSGDLEVRLADLGLVRHAHTARSNTGAGTPPYMSWDAILRLGPAKPSADVFALGVTVYQSVTGRKPSIARRSGKGTAHQSALTKEGLELYGLASDHLEGEALERRKALQGLPPEQLVDLDRLYGLSLEDTNLLRQELERHVAALGLDRSIAKRTQDALEGSLRRALAPLPDRRGEARDLCSALAQALVLLGTESSVQAAPTQDIPSLSLDADTEPVPTGSKLPVPQPTPRPTRSGGRLLALLGGGGLLAALCCLGVFFLGPGPEDTGDPPPPIPVDTDGDGVVDRADDCPTLPGPPSNGGCPLPEEPDPAPEDEPEPEDEEGEEGETPPPPPPFHPPPSPKTELDKLQAARSVVQVVQVVDAWKSHPGGPYTPNSAEQKVVLQWLSKAEPGSPGAVKLITAVASQDAAMPYRVETCKVIRDTWPETDEPEGGCQDPYVSYVGACFHKYEKTLCSGIGG